MKPLARRGFLGLVVILFALYGGELSGAYHPNHGEYNILIFSGNRFVEESHYDASGTYSVSDGKIEFVYENGTIKVRSFSKTKNTIIIGGIVYTKQK